MNEELQVGIDVGSTTVKAVVMDASGTIRWKRYQRHSTRQASLVREFLIAIESAHAGHPLRIFVTGSGGRAVAPHINASYIQEVNAVSYAVERRCPGTGSVVELGGQDAKVIIWKEDARGRKSTLTFMNDKCAGGTGATIDKILSKSGVSPEEAGQIRAEGITVHQVAAKCGVFAETDVVGLLKSGVAREEVVVSLGAAVVKQNLEVLVRGNILRDRVVLLGGPHNYLKVLTDFWRQLIPETWAILGWTPDPERPLDELIYVPPDSLYFAAIGAVLFGQESEALLGEQQRNDSRRLFPGLDALSHYLGEGRTVQLLASGAVQDALVASEEEVATFAERYAIPPFQPPELEAGSELRCFVGIDGGSTSSKLVLLDELGTLVYKDYLLSEGNPIEDVRNMFARMVEWRERHGVELNILGTGITGYASAILKEAFCLDLAVVETVAHMKSAMASYGDVDIICDIGGQDIKVLFMKHGRVVDFRLNTQCSAGNGYLLQTMAEQFGVPIEEYATRAFRARKAPAFNYGCAVFMEQDRVNFQQLGWSDEEIMAGLALVLPKNVWNYVVQEPHIARFGKRFVLQGGTQKNLAAVKAQVDHIKSKVPDAVVHVHRHADISGAIGVGLEARERLAGQPSRFIGIEQAAEVSFETRSDEITRCRFCKNSCPRTFVDIQVTPEREIRFISGNGCEKGAVDDIDQMRTQQRKRKALCRRYPNLVHRSAVDVFAEYQFEPMPREGQRVTLDGEDGPGAFGWLRRSSRRGFRRSSAAALARRQQMVVGIPRLLNMYYYAPFFSTYLRALGVGKVLYSDYTSARLWREGNIWGAIDPCFPAKVAPAHIYNLLERKKGLTHICFPIITHLESQVVNTLGNNACVIQMGTPEVVHAVFTRGRDHFAERGVSYLKPLVRMDRPREAVGELFEYFKDRMEITEEENAWAARQGFLANQRYLAGLRQQAKTIINQLVVEDRIGILVIGHPYHHDPGLNHEILEEFQVRGFPILCIESLPNDPEFLRSLFGDLGSDEQAESEFQINDVWMRNFNRNTNLKIWAARVAARHPNLAVIDLSSFKCGHDAPTYSYVESILDASETAHFLFHDIDQNKPRASLAIRIQTIEYFLREEEQRLRATSRGGARGEAS